MTRWGRAGLATAFALAALGACAPKAERAPASARALSPGDLSDRTLIAETARMDPAARDLARRHDPALRRPDLWGRPPGWARFDLGRAPDLGVPQDDAQVAEAVNSLRPFSDLPIRPMRPFVLKTDAADSARALRCMAQAVYYEAGHEPLKGQEAVAQVVLNRLRHPAYPKSICGVVYEGAGLPTGCQFTFTCDGALRFAPVPALWRRAEAVAKRALAGYVDKDVGSATHYHADYVAPYWAPTLVKMTQVGQHIFYRWTGPWGEPPAFTGHYAGREGDLSPALLASIDPRTQGLPGGPPAPVERKVTLALAGEVRTYTVLDPPATAATATGADRAQMTGAIFASRRQPTPEEIRKINDSLASFERAMPPAPAAAAPSAASAARPATQGGGGAD